MPPLQLMLLILVMLIWIGPSILVGVFATSKGRSGWGFFALSVCLSPLTGVIAALLVPRDEQRLRARAPKSAASP